MEEEQLERLEEKGNPGSNPAQTLEEKERQVIIQQALITLEASLRQAVVLRDAEGLSYEEISQVLELPLGTVKSRIHRGRVQLREKLMGHLDEL
jgi:RNA polymerase sigma-70 factor (ECF subfamily)